MGSVECSHGGIRDDHPVEALFSTYRHWIQGIIRDATTNTAAAAYVKTAPFAT